MSPASDVMQQLLQYVDGTLPAAEQAQVEDLLRKDSVARGLLRTIAEQAVVTADVERTNCQLPDAMPFAALRMPATRSLRWKPVLSGLVVITIIATLLSLAVPQHRAEAVMTVVDAHGLLEWTGDGGQVTTTLTAGEQLPGGSMELLTPDAWVELEFRDHSTVILTGLTAVTVSGTQQKAMQLRHGYLSAEVQPQSHDHPMLLRTPSAELEIPGTKFDVEAGSESTRLTVNEGRVHLKRRSDGAEVNVPAQRSVHASLEDTNALSVSGFQSPESVWRSDLRSDVVSGKWHSQLQMLSIKLKQAVRSGSMTEDAATAAYKEAAILEDARGSVWATASQHGAIIVLSVLHSTDAPVVLSEHSCIRVRGRAYSRTSLRFGLSVYQPDGGFAGKYSTRVSAEELATFDGEFEIELPIHRFLDATRSDGSPVGNELRDWWCVADSSAAKVAVSGVELMDHSEQDTP
jgi:hypothetical protein